MEVVPSSHVSLQHQQPKLQQQVHIRPSRRRTQSRSFQDHLHYSHNHHQHQDRSPKDDDSQEMYEGCASHRSQQKKDLYRCQLRLQHHYQHRLDIFMSSNIKKKKINVKKIQNLDRSMVMINKPLYGICMLLLLIPLTLTPCSSAQRTNPTTDQPSTAPNVESVSRLGYKDTDLPVTNGNPVDLSIADSAFDDVNTNNNNSNANSTSRDEGALDSNNTSGRGGDGGFSTDGLRTLITGINSDIPPPEDKQRTLEVVRQAHQNLLEPVIKTNKSNAFLSCETGEMIVKINFTEPFRGLAYADYDRSSPCKFFGDGSDYYEMRLPLKGCGTKQEAPRLFLNNIIVRYHRLVELEEDEIKTIVCRYPPPLAPPPKGPPVPLLDAPPDLPEAAKLTQYEPIVIIAGLLFLTLMMLGLGAGSYLIKRQNIKPIHTPLPPPPLAGLTDHETYLDNQSIITEEDFDTLHKNTLLYAQPHLDTQFIDDTFVTTTHEIDTHEDTVHHTDTRYFRQLDVGSTNLEDAFITNEEDVTTKDLNTLTKLAATPKYMVKNIEDTFITKVDEIDETEQISTMHRKKVKKQPPSLTTVTTTDQTTTQIDDKTTIDSNTAGGRISRPIKSKLTTTDQFQHLQTIVDIFDETYDYATETATYEHNSSNTEDIIRKRFWPRINRMPHYDRTTLRSLLLEDETFRSLVIDAATNETLVASIRQNPDYTNKLTMDTWNLFEEILVETAYMYKHHHQRTSEISYHEEFKAQNYEQIGQQQHYYNYDHVKQLPMVGHIADPDFDSRTYTKSSGDSESRESLSPELERRYRRIKGRREQRPSHTTDFCELEQQQHYHSHRRPNASLLSDPDLQPQSFDGMNSEIDTASIPDYGDNLLDEPTLLRGQHHIRPNNKATTKDGYNHSYHRRAHVTDEQQQQYYATTKSSLHSHDDNEFDDYSGRIQNKGSHHRHRPNESSKRTLVAVDHDDYNQDTTTNWIGYQGDIFNPDQYDNEENFPVYTSYGNQDSPSYHRSKSSSRKKENNQR